MKGKRVLRVSAPVQTNSDASVGAIFINGVEIMLYILFVKRILVIRMQMISRLEKYI